MVVNSFFYFNRIYTITRPTNGSKYDEKENMKKQWFKDTYSTEVSSWDEDNMMINVKVTEPVRRSATGEMVRLKAVRPSDQLNHPEIVMDNKDIYSHDGDYWVSVKKLMEKKKEHESE